MNGKKLARIRECARCEDWRNCGAWPWPRCIFEDIIELDDDFMESGECPAGKWAGLADVVMGKNAVRPTEDLLKAALDGLKENVRVQQLEKLVSSGKISPTLAARVATQGRKANEL